MFISTDIDDKFNSLPSFLFSVSNVDYDVVVVGAGIAGLTAAIYASRQKLRTLIIAKDIGGQLNITPAIENYPGFKVVSGSELIQRIYDQVQALGVEILFDEVVGIEDSEGIFLVKTKDGYEFTSETVILAFGKTPREMNVPGERELKGRGVSYCAICDAPLFQNKRVAVVGWGPQAFEAVSLLCRYNNYVYLIHRGRSKLELEKIPEKCRERFEEYPETIVREVRGDAKVRSIVLESLENGKIWELEVDGVFVELGYEMKTEWLRGFVELSREGEIIVDMLGRTSREGVFAAGDVTNIPYKQAVISAGQGAIAALSAYNYIQEKKGGAKIKSDWREIFKKDV